MTEEEYIEKTVRRQIVIFAMCVEKLTLGQIEEKYNISQEEAMEVLGHAVGMMY